MTEINKDEALAKARAIARQFVTARLSGRALPGYPGEIPASFPDAYAIQDAAIALWPDEIVGWKLGRVGSDFEARFGNVRLAGPIFRKSLQKAAGEVNFPIFADGFAAVEGEFVIVLAKDAPPGKRVWSTEEAMTMAGAYHIGVETAGSPLKTINELGPTVVVSDFGNNAGLILGNAVPGAAARALDTLCVETFLEGRKVGEGSAANIPGGPIESLRFLLENAARRGLPLRAGMLVTTGAITGIHDIKSGQRARIAFGDDGEILCHAQTV